MASEPSELMKLLTRCKRAGIAVNASHGTYDNWGGYITQRDVDGLNMYVTPADGTVKVGACVKLLDSAQVTANGVVDACACRDVDATLVIGKIESEPLADILGARDAGYRKIIDEQQAGNFRPVCKICDFYRSIYHQPKSHRQGRVPVQTIAEYVAAIEQRARAQRSTAGARTAQRPVCPPAGRTGAAR